SSPRRRGPILPVNDYGSPPSRGRQRRDLGGRMKLSCCAIVVIAAMAPVSAHAQDVANFYRGRTINLTAGFNPGGGADTYARLIARHIGKHIPGNPTVVVRNMQGAGSVIAANHIYNVSAKDGTELGLFAGNIIIDPLMGSTQHKYDAR